MHFLEDLGKKVFFAGGSKTAFLEQEVHYYVVYIIISY